MMDHMRRKILKTGAAATVMAAAPRVFAQQTGQGGATMSFYDVGGHVKARNSGQASTAVTAVSVSWSVAVSG